MTARLNAPVARRPSLPLTEQDDRDLAQIREAPSYRRALAQLSGTELPESGTSEAALLHAVFEAGVKAVQRAAEEAGYAAVAEQQAADAAERRASARRRRPSWADEE